MSNCCGGKTSKKKLKQNQSFSPESRDSNWLDQIKGAFGFNTKPVLNSKEDDVNQQNHQKSCRC